MENGGDDWPLPLKNLSATSLSTFSRCAEQWRRTYLQGERYIPSASSVVGNAAHGAAETNYSQKIDTGDDLSTSDVEIAFADSFDREVERNGGASEIDWAMKVGKERLILRPGEAKDKGVPVVRSYHTGVANRIQPVRTEEWFRISIGKVPVPIIGKMDLITGTQKTDIKFGAVAKKFPEVMWRIQGLVYLMVGETDTLSGISHLPFSWHTGSWGSERYGPKIYTPDESPELSMTRTENTAIVAERHISALSETMVAYYTRYGPDEPWPTTALTHSWACNACSFHPRHGGNCFWWIGPGKEVPEL